MLPAKTSFPGKDIKHHTKPEAQAFQRFNNSAQLHRQAKRMNIGLNQALSALTQGKKGLMKAIGGLT